MRKTKVLAGMTAGLMLLGSAALADIVENDLNVVGGEKETVELLVGESESVNIYIGDVNAPSGDRNGCNIGGGSGAQLVLDVSSSDAAVSVTPSQIVFDGDEACEEVRPVTVTGVSGTGAAGALVSFTVNPSSKLKDDSLTQIDANFVVNVTAPQELEGREAPAIANAYLHASEDNSDCKAANGTNKNQNNWHGQLISKVAQHFEGQSFAPAQENVVTDYVDGLCGR
jgi:hypothetical protein